MPQNDFPEIAYRQTDGYVLEVQQNPFDRSKVVVELAQNITDYLEGYNYAIVSDPTAANNRFPINAVRYSNYTRTENRTLTSTIEGDLIYFNSTNTSLDTTFQNTEQTGGIRRKQFLNYSVSFDYDTINRGNSRYKKCDYTNKTIITDYSIAGTNEIPRNFSRLIQYTAEMTCVYNPKKIMEVDDFGPEGATLTRSEVSFIKILDRKDTSVGIDWFTYRKQSLSKARILGPQLFYSEYYEG